MPDADTSLVDPGALRKLRGLQADDGTELAITMIEMFAEATQLAIRQIGEGVAAAPGGLPEARRLAHSLRGSAGMLGAHAIVDLAGAMESHAAKGEADLIPPLLARLAAIADATIAALRKEQAKIAAET
jgi:HPt (histidine-containing phosphotransfer) domain-containing protein